MPSQNLMDVRPTPAVVSTTALVEACLAGDEDAWSTLIDRYKRLIYSIPIKHGFTRDEAGDIFQSVCLDLVAELARVRNPEALPQWLIQTTLHKCQRHRLQAQRMPTGIAGDLVDRSAPSPDSLIREVQQEQALREAIDNLQPRCRKMIEMLFLQARPRPYAEVAAHLGIATGSVGFIRGRCLDRLRVALRKAGL
jgi:RNA polymerase sigma factor (sigma-70 family)